ncbi:glycerol kinase [Candidatus Mycoplasma haematolamae str. Purdue]|uniref:Glycerol kinase n=1 Tax=Mycoplasma haematolamae (strain Purdue) TaxID=1212765 RepID=I7C564_MYCHA|nr:FGGY family carbohydrate kinase [Candidatus Mycoplasma haematolamae]AFO51642.1 glycerol kinase [Candidatus Mycoplasma haematolamae str. Purdue]
MTREKISLALDLGSSAFKLLLYSSKRGQILCTEHPFSTTYEEGGRVEHNPEELWPLIYRELDNLLSSLPKEDAPSTLGISTQRESVVIWEKDTGKELSSIVSWQDTRTDSLLEDFSREQQELIWSRTGLKLSSYCSAIKFSYLLKNLALPSNYLLGTLDSWLAYKLSKGRYFVTDYTSASRTALFNLETLKWDGEICSLFGVDPSSLPNLVENNQEIGEIEIGSHSLTLQGLIGDQQSSLYSVYRNNAQRPSMGGREKSLAALTYGTGVFLLRLLPEDTNFKEIISKSSYEGPLIVTIAWKNKDEGVRFALELSLSNCGQALNWISRTLDIDLQTPLVKERRNLPYCFPFFSGRWFLSENRHLKSGFLGLNLETTKSEVLTSFYEGLAFSIRKGLELVGIDYSSCLSVGGGMTRSQEFLELQSSYLGTSLSRDCSMHMSALGASLLSIVDEVGKNTEEVISPKRDLEAYISCRYKNWLNYLDSLN